MKTLEGKVAVITGGSSGIGLATARLFQEVGAKVAISGRNQASLDDAVRELGVGVVAVRSDVSKLRDLDALFEVVVRKLGRIDVLFANAGIAKFAAVSDISEEVYDETFDINVKGVFFTVQKAIPFLNDNASVILNTSFVNQAGVPTTSVYAASKAAVRSLARSVSSELANRGIRVNVVSPGPISTPIYGKLGLAKEVVDAFAAKIVSQVPLRRFGKPEEVAQAALFLASSASSYVTGVELNVDSYPRRSAGIRAPFWRKQAGAREVRQALPEPVSSLPEHMPRLTWVPTDEDIRVISDGAVLNAEWNDKVVGKFAGLENSLEVGAQKTRRDDGFRRRIAVPAQPVRVRATDHFRQASAAAVEIDGSGLTGIAGENTNRGVIRRERVANANHCVGHFAPSELLIGIAVCRVGDSPPA